MNKRNIKAELTISSARQIKESHYWQDKFSAYTAKCFFPYDFSNQGEKLQKCYHDFQIPAETVARILKISSGSELRLHMILTALTAVLLERYTYESKESITLCMPVYRQEIQGNFINTILPLRINIDCHLGFKQLLLEVRQTVTEAVEHQNYPMETLLYHLEIPFKEGDSFPLFDVAVLLENIHDRDYLDHIHLNMLFIFTSEGESLRGCIEYNGARYNSATIERISRHFIRLMTEVLFNVERPLYETDMLAPEERQRLMDTFNGEILSYPNDKTISQLFEEQVERTPDRTALVSPIQSTASDSDTIYWTYSWLNRRANQLARYLRERGILPGHIVALLLDRTDDMIIAILGVIKSGAAYLPIGPETPVERIVRILQDANTSFLLTHSGVLSNFSFTALQNLRVTRHMPVKTQPRKPVSNMDTLSIPDRSLVDYDKYTHHISLAMVKHCITMQGTRGCPYSCAYCARLWPKKQVIRSAEHLMQEVQLYYDMGVRRFALIDDIFNLDIENSSRFFRSIIDRGMKLQLLFPAGLRGDIMTETYIDLMVQAGTVNISVALETASPRLQKSIRKNLNIEKLRRNLEYICQKHPHVILDLFTMHGLPTETEEEALMTLDFIKGLKWLHFPLINITRIYPNTPMEQLALDSGISRESIIQAENLPWHEASETLPFDKSFTMKYQTDFLENYFLKKERLLHVLPYQMQTLTEDEIVQKYMSYLPAGEEIETLDKLLAFLGVTREELGGINCVPDDRFDVAGLGDKIRAAFPQKAPDKDSLPVLLLDLSLAFTPERSQLDAMCEAPLGLMYLLTHLYQEFGDRVDGRVLKSGVDFDSDEELKAFFEDFQPRVIGIRTLTFYKDFFHRTISCLRQWGFDGVLITGGPYATNGYTALLQDVNIDAVVLAEGELTFSELIGAILENNGKLPGYDVLSRIPGLVLPYHQTKAGHAADILMLDHLWTRLSLMSGDNLEPVNQSTDPVYTIFTSGSTGIPKGVLVRHENVHNLVTGLNNRVYHRYPHPLKIALVSPYVFDASVKQIFAALISGQGHTLFVVPEEARSDGFALIDYFERFKVEVSDGTPTHLHLLMETYMENVQRLHLRHFIIGGESLSRALVEKFLRQFPVETRPMITNVYGPTECTVDTTTFDVSIDTSPYFETIPIGKVMPNQSVYILEPSTLNHIQPIGVAGELCVGGDSVSSGYLNRPELTSQKFINSLYSQGALYRTGDLGMWLPDGNIRFLGRRDQQVKIRGYRLELGEIENRLLSHQDVSEAVVVAGGSSDEQYLCAYIVPVKKAVSVGYTLMSDTLRRHLSLSLPDYMIPPYYVLIEKIPLTVNGKVDRRALPEPKLSNSSHYVAPTTDIQRQLVEIWSSILKLELEKISIEGNFFEMGGHSLKATILIARVHKIFDVKIPLVYIFKDPTIRGMEAYIRSAGKENHVSITPAPQQEFYELSSAQQRLYFIQQMDRKSTVYNLLMVIEVTGDLNYEKVNTVTAELIFRHESLRTAFVTVDNRPVQKILDPSEFLFRITYYDYSKCSDCDDKVLNLLDTVYVKPFDLSKAPLLRMGVIRKNSDCHVLIVTMHHIISDGTSQTIFVREFIQMYQGSPLPPMKLQYRDYSHWQQQHRSRGSQAIKRQELFWMEQFSGNIPVLKLPYDFQRPEVVTFSGYRTRFSVESNLAVRLRKMIAQEGATLYMLMLAIYTVFLYKVSGQQDIVVGSPVAARPDDDLQSIIGMFVNTLPFRNFPKDGVTFLSFFRDVRRSTLDALANQEYSFEDLVKQVVKGNEHGRNPIFDVVLAVQNMELPDMSVSGLSLSSFEYVHQVSKFDLGFFVYPEEDGYYVSVEYNTHLFRAETVEMFICNFKEIVTIVLDNPEILLKDISISSGLLSVQSDAVEIDLGF